MTSGPRRAGYAICAAAVIGCASGQPQPHLDAVLPNSASSDQDVRLILIGSGFIPSYRLDPTSNEWVAVMDGFSGRLGVPAHWAPLTNFGWVGPTEISASLTTDAATGLWNDRDAICPGWREDGALCACDIEITDPRGRKTMLATAFSETGPDRKGPDLEVESPATNDPYCPGATIHGRVKAIEEPPRYIKALTWKYTAPDGSQAGLCRFEQGSIQVDCSFDVLISPTLPSDAKPKLEVIATNDATDETDWGTVIKLDPRPFVSSVTPLAGGTAGGTNVVIGGSGFLRDSRVYFGDVPLNPDGGIYVDDRTITGYTPAATRPEQVVVTVKSRLGVASFESFQYLAPPRIKSIEPSFGVEGESQSVTVSGSNFRETTIIYVGSSLGSAQAVAVDSLSSVQIKGSVSGSRGTATVWALDEVSGWSSLPDGFTWNPP